MFVEVLGLPGAGKSSLIRALLPGLRRAGTRVRTIKNLATLPAEEEGLPRYISSQPDRTTLYRATQFRARHGDLMGHIDARPDMRDADRFLFSLTGCYLQAYQEHRARIDLALIDEGFLHRGMDAHMSETDPLVFAAYLDLMPLPDAILYVNTGPRIAFRRAVGRRAEKRANRQRVIEKLGDLETFFLRRTLLEVGIEHLAKRGTTIIDIDAAQPIEDCAAIALDQLSGMLNRRREMRETA